MGESRLQATCKKSRRHSVSLHDLKSREEEVNKSIETNALRLLGRSISQYGQWNVQWHAGPFKTIADVEDAIA